MAHKDHDTHAPPLGFQKDHDKECVQLYMDDFKKSTYSYTIPLHKNTNTQITVLHIFKIHNKNVKSKN
jgi:hypothetical protein